MLKRGEPGDVSGFLSLTFAGPAFLFFWASDFLLKGRRGFMARANKRQRQTANKQITKFTEKEAARQHYPPGAGDEEMNEIYEAAMAKERAIRGGGSLTARFEKCGVLKR